MLLGVRSDGIVGETMYDKLMALKDIGYDFMELVVTPETLADYCGSENPEKYYPKEALRMLHRAVGETGMPILSVSYSNLFAFAEKSEQERAVIVNEVYQCIDLASALGAETILSATCENADDLPAVAKLYKTELAGALDYAFERNIRICFEPVARFKNEYVVMLARMIDHPAAYTYFDMGNCLHFGEDPIAQLLDCCDIVGALHIKHGRNMKQEDMPMYGILNILNNADFDGVGVMEIQPGENNENLVHNLDLCDRLGYRDDIG